MGWHEKRPSKGFNPRPVIADGATEEREKRQRLIEVSIRAPSSLTGRPVASGIPWWGLEFQSAPRHR